MRRVVAFRQNVADRSIAFLASTTILSARRLPTNSKLNRLSRPPRVLANPANFILTIAVVAVMNRRAFAYADVIINRRVGSTSIFKSRRETRRNINFAKLMQKSIGSSVTYYADTVLEARPPTVIGERHN